MNDKVARLKTPDDCENFAKNVEGKFPELAQAARRRGVELRAAVFGAVCDAEREALQAVYAVEEVASQRNGRRTRASRTWQSIQRYGILETVERVVSKKQPTDGYMALVEMGMSDFTFEAVVLRHPTLFKPETVEQAQARINERP